MTTLKHCLAGLLLLPLAGCGGGGSPSASADPVVNECRAEARSAPSVRALGAQMNFQNPNNVMRVQAEQREEENRVFADCMRRRGAARGGGVAPAQRPIGSF